MIWYIHTLVSFSYPVIPLTLLSHHNEPQFPVHYLIQIKREPAFMELSFSFPLYGHDFFALCIHCRINFFDIFICALLDFLLKFFDLILRYILFCKFLKCIICITTNVADCYFGCFAFFLDIFNQFLTAFLCKFRLSLTQNAKMPQVMRFCSEINTKPPQVRNIRLRNI